MNYILPACRYRISAPLEFVECVCAVLLQQIPVASFPIALLPIFSAIPSFGELLQHFHALNFIKLIKLEKSF